MIFRPSRRHAAPAITSRVPDGIRVYAIGDVHGRDDLLVETARLIDIDRRSAAGDTLTILLGDYVDRGAHPAAVIERLSHGAFPTPLLALRGNHEQMLLEALEDEATFESWRKYGGLETLVSYGVDVSHVMRGQGYEQAQKQLRERMPAEHLAFLKALPYKYEIGDYFFTHAGVRPGVPLKDQTIEDLLWIRDDFLLAPQFHEKVVVHGHTPVQEAQLLPHRINIDTGAYATGQLTCLVLEGVSRRVLPAA